MALHEAIQKLLLQAGRPLSSFEIAAALNKNGWYKKRDGSPIKVSHISARVNKYPQLFERNGSVISLKGKLPRDKSVAASTKIELAKLTRPVAAKDEHYVIDLCDKVLGVKSSRQHRFDFLRGDADSRGVAKILPVDAYYEKLNLVVEYCENQHTESVKFFDKMDKMTVSGVHRGEQRKRYDERRREILPKHGIRLVEISYTDFNYDKRKRIVRDAVADEKVVRRKLGR